VLENDKRNSEEQESGIDFLKKLILIKLAIVVLIAIVATILIGTL
jgi:hypothetical protein